MGKLNPDVPSDAFEKAKNWWESKTIWATIVSIAFIVADAVGIDLGVIVGAGGTVEDTVQTANTIWNEVLAIIAMVVAWWGRVKAIKVIK